MSIQIIKKDNKPDYLVIPYDEFRAMAREDLLDAVAAQVILSDPIDGELSDFQFADYAKNSALLARLEAGLTQKELAEKLGVTQAYVSKLELAGKVSVKALLKIKSVLE
ncbi:MAG: helix-turn-helix transcriptional regulator [Candidatus Marinimicrobia bacterium]|nr:helix-turn-helix transcriptional regulator [Candidatus Neomarinimicrobiota bacterium]